MLPTDVWSVAESGAMVSLPGTAIWVHHQGIRCAGVPCAGCLMLHGRDGSELFWPGGETGEDSIHDSLSF